MNMILNRTFQKKLTDEHQVKFISEDKKDKKTNALTEGISLALIIALINPEFWLEHAFEA